ncbi:MAG: choice-of-anchor L domain-containing protein, partial [Bacteroidota bacterium]
MKKRLIVLFIAIVAINFSFYAQSVTLPYNNATDYVQNVLVGGGVTVSNVTSNCIFSAPATIGYFNNFGGTLITLNEGIIMSSGDVQLADDPNSSGSSGATSGTGSDPQLAALVPGYPINDAAVLQFDFVPLATPMTFRYVFASEEYPEWVNSSYNDAFGFFVTGPNPGGGNYTNQNIALIPGTSLPVTIDNVNIGSYSQYYVTNSSGGNVTYDAFTTVLTAQIDVVPCVPYHIKIAVGDAGDSAYDSAVFLEANSFSTDALDVSVAYTNPSASINAVEGCNDAVLTFTLSNTPTSDYTISYTIGGSAYNGTDYTYLPGSATILAGSNTTQIVISPFNDGMTEGPETVTLIFQTSACGSDTIEVVIEDPPLLTPNFTVTTPVCANSPSTIDYTGVGADTYTWDFDGGTQSGSGLGPFDVTWTTAGTYDVVLIVNSPYGCGTAVDTMQVIVNPIPTSTFTLTPICENDTSNIVYIGNAGSGATYNWSFPSGTPSVGAGQGPFDVIWNTAGTYTCSLTVIENGCSSTYQVDIDVMPPGSPNCCAIPVSNAGSDFSVCGNSFNLQAIPDVGLGTWTCSSSGVNISDIHSSVSSVNISGAYGPYTFTWTENNGSGCVDNDQVVVTLLQIPNANAGIDFIVCGTSINLNGSQSVGGSTISWTSLPGGVSFSPPTSAAPTADGTFGTYQLIITETNGICIDKDTTVVQYLPIPAPDAGIDQSVCGNSASLAGILSNPSNTGYWTGPGQVSFSDIYDPNATAYAATFAGSQVSYTLTWYETNGVCDGTDQVQITFIKPPLANAGYGGDVCVYDFELAANTTGVTYTSANWTASVAGITIVDPTNDTTMIELPTPPSYDLYHCILPVYFTWSITAGTGCSSVDSTLVYFYDTPEAYAGGDDSICGLVYNMEAVKSIDCSEGLWSVISQPVGTMAPDFNDVNDPNTTVSVTGFGYWEFQWNEWHQQSSVCNTSDTVRIHFIETPTIDAGPRDTVCGHWAQMNATTSGYSGTWITPGGGYIFASGPSLTLEDTSYQHVYNTWVYYNQLGDSAELVWRECMGFCCSYDTVMVLFDEEFPA